jgi:hypothetical protein
MKTLVWFIFCCRRILRRSDSPRPQAKLPGHLRVLSPEYLSASTSRRFQRTSITHSHYPRCATTILSADIRDLGEFALVLEHSYQSYLCYAGDIGTAMGPPIPPDHS